MMSGHLLESLMKKKNTLPSRVARWYIFKPEIQFWVII
jgi:hypothetical protein